MAHKGSLLCARVRDVLQVHILRDAVFTIHQTHHLIFHLFIPQAFLSTCYSKALDRYRADRNAIPV